MRVLFQRLQAGSRIASDPDKVTQLLKPFLVVVFSLTLAHGAALALFEIARYLPLLLVFHLPVMAMMGVSYALILRGRLSLAVWLSLLTLWAGFTVGVARMGGMQAPAFIGGYILAVVIAAIFLGFRVSVLFTIAGVLSGLVFALLRQNGLVAPPDMSASPFVTWLAQAFILFGVMELMRLATLNTSISFDHSRREQKYFKALIENSSDMVAVADAFGQMTYISPSVERILGIPSEQIIGKSGFDFVHPDDRGLLLTDFARLLLKPGSSLETQFRIHNAAGDWRWVEASGSNFLFDTDVQGIILNYRDITDRKEKEERLAYDAIHDALTGLPNRVLFMDRLAGRLRRAERDLDNLFAVMILDLDHFKNVNDSLGHQAGDRLLVEVARRLERCLRTSDSVARLGGDEFAILLDTTDGTAGAEQMIKRLLKEIHEPLSLMEKEIPLEASVGVVIGPADYERAGDILRDAEIAMYRAKELGRARYAFFSDRMRSGVLERVGLEAEIRSALKKNQFRVYYQPVYSLKTGTLAGFEALLRWQHPERGLLLPGVFLDVAEECGVIIDLDRWVMRESCRQLRAWQADYPAGKSLIMNVNISRKHLTRGDLVDTVSEILQETGLDANCLRPEITESLFMESYEDAIAVVRRLDKMGVRVEIDDFGTGHSSLALLAELREVRTLKIDRQFVRSMHEGADRLEIIRMIISLGFSLKKEVIAEGIETEEQLANLRAMDCEFGQGFYFSRGVSAVEAGALIALEAASVQE